MRFLMKQKYFSMRDRYTITDESGRGWYQVEGKFFSIGKKLHMYDMSGREIFYIKQRLFRWFPTFDFMAGDQRVARVRGKFSIFTKRLALMTDQGDYKIRGSVLSWDFDISRDDKHAAHISKHVLKIADTYTLDVAPGESNELMVATALVMDTIYHRHH